MKKTGKDGSKDIHKADGEKTQAHKADRDSNKSKNKVVDADANSTNTVEELPSEQLSEGEDAKVNATAQELADVKDRYMRLLAEYDNFRKRSQKEREGLYKDAVAEVSKSWLLVVDNIERALDSVADATEDKLGSITEGVAMIYKQASDVLSSLGVEEIPSAVGTAFDPNLHAAVTHVDDDALGEQCIAQVFQKGYRLGDRVIRHTMVQVAN